MNINKWGDSWGAGCLISTIGICYVQHSYSLSRHRQKIENGELNGIIEINQLRQFGLIGKRGGIFSVGLYITVLIYQCGQVLLWPTVWKTTRYHCNSTSQNITVCPWPLILVIIEFILGKSLLCSYKYYIQIPTCRFTGLHSLICSKSF